MDEVGPNGKRGKGLDPVRTKYILKLVPLVAPLLLAPLACCSVAAIAQTSLAPRLISPETHADHSVTLRLYAPNAHEVMFRLEGASAVAMQKDNQGIWSFTTAPLAPDFYGYSFRVDGTRLTDPSNLIRWPSFVSGESELHVRGAPSLPWEVNAVPHGVLHHHFYHSAVTADERDFYVYTPSNYGRGSSRPYPSLYLLHGGGDDAQGWVLLGHANVILDNLIAQGKIRPMIVIMPLGYGAPEILQRDDATLERRNFQEFTQALLTEIIPQVDAAYSVSRDRELRAIAGLSMGADEALITGLNHLREFAWVGSFSGGILGNADLSPASAAFTKFNGWFPRLSPRANADIRLLWVACGSNDEGTRAPNRALHEWLKSKGIQHTYSETSGKHTWMVWRRNLAEFLPLLFR